MSVGMHPHAIGANSKSVNEGLKRLREVGLAWRSEKRYWALADPLLTAWVRDHTPSWALAKHAARPAAERAAKVAARPAELTGPTP